MTEVTPPTMFEMPQPARSRFLEVHRLQFGDISPDAWDAVAGNAITPMQTYLWASAYAETLADGPLQILAAGNLEAPLGLLVLAKSRVNSRRVTLLGAEDLWESVSVPARNQAAHVALAKAAVSISRPIGLGHYPKDDPFANEIMEASRGKSWVMRRGVAARANPRIGLDASWISPESKLSSRRRSDLRRMSRVAGEMGNVTYDLLSPGPQEAASFIDEALSVEEKGWKGHSGTAIRQHPALAAFFKAYGRLASEAGILRVFFMRISGKPAAMQIAVELNRALWLLKIGFDETYKRCSPGNLLMRETIAFAARKELNYFEFLGKEAPWTTLWAGGARLVESLRIYPISPLGAGALAGDVIEAAWRRVRARMEGKEDEKSVATSED